MSLSRSGLGAVLLFLLTALTWWSVVDVSPPSAAPADAPAEQFSAGRAYAHVEQISREWHPAGSAAAGRVREHIVATLTGLGLQPEVVRSVGATGNLGGYAMANVENVVATIPGTDSTGTVYLMAHYDSVQVSYGANDDGAGTATLLETARAVLAGPRPRNDVVLLFTDAEEACLCGAEAFVHDNPEATGVVLNVEARGSRGPAIMFETTLGNADVVGVYADAAPYPVATSFAVEVYRLLPNDTDFSPFRDSGRFVGLNSAYIDGSPAYHSPQDSRDNFSTATLQQHGANALALAEAFGETDLAQVRRGADATYFPVFGTLVTYPGSLVWVIAVAALVSVLVATWRTRRATGVSVARTIAAVALGLVPLVLPIVAASGLWPLLVAIRPGYGRLSDPWQPGWFRLAVVCVVVTVVLAWWGLFRRRFGAELLALTALFWVAVLGATLAALTPGGSYLAAVPALAAGLAALVPGSKSRLRTLASFLAGAVTIAVLAPTVLLFFPALGLELAAAPALFATLAMVSLLPVLDLLFPALDRHDAETSRIPRPALVSAVPALVAAVLAVAATGVGLAVDRFDARHPVPVEMMYALDTSTGQAFWVRPWADPTGWSDAMVSRREDLSDRFPFLPSETTVGRAPAAPLTAPTVRVVSATPTAAGRRLQVVITPQRASRVLYVDLPDTVVTAATANGRPVEQRGEGPGLGLIFNAAGPEGLRLTLDLDGKGPARIRVMDGSDDLASLPGFVPRPDGVGVGRSHTSEMVLVSQDSRI